MIGFMRILKRTALMLLLLALLLPLFACGEPGSGPSGIQPPESGEMTEGGAESTTMAEIEAETETSYEITLSSAYKIVYPEDPSSEIFLAANGLVDALFARTGEFYEIGSDLVLNIPGYEKSEYEILIGNCDRDVTRKAASTLRAGDQLITVIDHQVVILGGNDALTAEAVNFFIEVLLENESLPSGILYRKDGTYRLDTVSVNGVDIRDFRIVYKKGTNSPYYDVAMSLRELIRDYCGYTLEVVDSGEAEAPYEFLIGDCARASVGSLSADEAFTCAMKATTDGNGCKIAFDAQNDYTIGRALEGWFSQYFDADASGSFNAVIEYAEKLEAVTPGKPLIEGATMRVMSNNILSADQIETRAPLLVEIYLEYLPDIIGFQEFPPEASTLIYQKLSEFYGIADENIGTSATASRTPIFYRKDLYRVIEAETFYYDSRWPKTHTKTLAWAVLENKATGQRFAVLNTHYAIVSDSYDTLGYYGKQYSNSVEGVQWRNDNSRQVLETLQMVREKHGAEIPVLFMGDLNCNVNSEALKMVGAELDNAMSCAMVSKSTGTASTHSIGKAPSTTSLPIDHIYVTSDSIDVYTHLILTSGENVLKSSDHCPVICEITIK